MSKKIFAVLIVFTLFFGLFTMTASAVTSEELTAENLVGEFQGFRFYFDPLTGTIVLIGQGKMPDFTNVETPWAAYAELITRVIISEGITSVSANAFAGCENITSVVIPSTIEEIAADSFSGCEQIETVEFVGSAEVLQAIIQESPAAAFDLAAVTVTEVTAEAIIAETEQVTEAADAAVEEIVNATEENPEPGSELSRTPSPAATEVPVTVVTVEVLPDNETDNSNENDDFFTPEPEAPAPTATVIIPVIDPTQEPTATVIVPIIEPTVEPTQEPTAEPTQEPTVDPTHEPAGVTYSYTVEGNDTVQVTKLVDGKPVYSESIGYYSPSTKAYTYDENGKLVKVLENFLGNGSNSTETTYEYDENDRLVKTTIKSSLNTEIVTNTYEGNKRIETSSSGSQKTITEYDADNVHNFTGNTYTSNGKLLQQVISSETDGTVTSVWKEYSDEGSLLYETTEISVYENDRIISRNTEIINYSNDENATVYEDQYEYNEDGVLVKQSETYSHGDYNRTFTYSYQYENRLPVTVSYVSESQNYTYQTTTQFTFADALVSSLTADLDSGTRTINIRREDEKLVGYTNTYTDENSTNWSTFTDYSVTYADDGTIASAYAETSEYGEQRTETFITINGKLCTTSYRSVNNEGYSFEASIEYDSEGTRISNTNTERDGEGNLIRKTVFTPVYDAEGREIQIVSVTTGAEEEFISKNTKSYEYNDKGNVAKESSEYVNEKGIVTVTTYVWNEDGHMQSNSSVTKDAEENIISEWNDEYSYDSDGNPVSLISTTKNSEGTITYQSVSEGIAGELRPIYSLSTDSVGYTTESRTTYDSDGAALSETSEKKDHDGNVVSSSEYHQIAGQLRQTSYFSQNDDGSSYGENNSYDEYGNVTLTVINGIESNGSKYRWSTSNEYDENGKLSKSVNEGQNTDGSLYEQETVYDADGNQLSYYSRDTYTDQSSYVANHIYSTEGNTRIDRVETTLTDTGGNVLVTLSVNTTTYDDNGNVVLEKSAAIDDQDREIGNSICYYENGERNGKTEYYNYSYDENGTQRVSSHSVSILDPETSERVSYVSETYYYGSNGQYLGKQVSETVNDSDYTYTYYNSDGEVIDQAPTEEPEPVIPEGDNADQESSTRSIVPENNTGDTDQVNNSGDTNPDNNTGDNDQVNNGGDINPENNTGDDESVNNSGDTNPENNNGDNDQVNNSDGTNPENNTGDTDQVNNNDDTNPENNTGDDEPKNNSGDTNPENNTGDDEPKNNSGDTNPENNNGDTDPVNNSGDTNPENNNGDDEPVNNSGDTNPENNNGDDEPVNNSDDTNSENNTGDDEPVNNSGDTNPENNTGDANPEANNE